MPPAFGTFKQARRVEQTDVEQGRFDLATPTHALKYNLDHLRLPPGGRERIHVNLHDAGHMMYLNADAGRQFRENVVGFIRDTDRL